MLSRLIGRSEVQPVEPARMTTRELMQAVLAVLEAKFGSKSTEFHVSVKNEIDRGPWAHHRWEEIVHVYISLPGSNSASLSFTLRTQDQTDHAFINKAIPRIEQWMTGGVSAP